MSSYKTLKNTWISTVFDNNEEDIIKNCLKNCCYAPYDGLNKSSEIDKQTAENMLQMYI
jgi:hypothetical protein